MSKLTVVDPHKDIPPIEITGGVVLVHVDDSGGLTVSHYERGVTKPIAFFRQGGDVQIKVEA